MFHNYGHGGAGISLAYGSGYITAKSIDVYVPSANKTQCAVMGCGIMGLFSAIELSKRGNQVKIYTEKIPVKGQTSDLIASSVAAGKWQPGGYDMEADYLKHEVLAKLSL